MFLKNEDGAALVLVLLFLLIGTILVSALVTTARNHINIAVHEEGMSKAFYNAESGVEFIRANKDDAAFNNIEEEINYYLSFNKVANEIEINEYDDDDEIKAITSDDLDIKNADNLKFKVTINKDNSHYLVKSKGFYNSNPEKIYTQEITFNLVTSGDFTKTFNLKAEFDPENDNLSDIIHSQSEFLYPDAISIKKDISPGWEDWETLKENAEIWSDDLSYDEKIIIHNEDLKINKADELKDSILFIDGNLEINPHNTWENSIIVVNGNLKFNGIPNSFIDNSIFFVYGDVDNSNNMLHTAGSIKEDNWDLELNFEDLPYDFNQEKDKFLKKEMTNWNQL